LIVCAVVAVTVPGLPFTTAELTGRIDVISGAKTTPGSGAVIWVSGVSAPPPPSGATMASKDKRFEPHVLAVPRGATITFPNFDKIHHNVFSRTPGSEFDLGLYRGGNFREFRFTSPGLVRVYCNIHSQMAAYIMVLDGLAFAVADTEGRYRIEGLPEGHREVRIWHEMAGEMTAFVDVVAGHPATLNMTLDASNYKESAHKNKYGEDYPPVALDDDRY
jgi:plastocyanin